MDNYIRHFSNNSYCTVRVLWTGWHCAGMQMYGRRAYNYFPPICILEVRTVFRNMNLVTNALVCCMVKYRIVILLFQKNCFSSLSTLLDTVTVHASYTRFVQLVKYKNESKYTFANPCRKAGLLSCTLLAKDNCHL